MRTWTLLLVTLLGAVHCRPTATGCCARSSLPSNAVENRPLNSAVADAGLAPNGVKPMTKTKGRSVPLVEQLEKLRRGGRTKVRYVAPVATELTAYREWFERVLRQEASAPAPGFGVDRLPGLVLLREAPGQRRGAGAIVLREKAQSELVIEAPHTFFDRGTLELGTCVFEATRATALLINTVHRGNPAENGEKDLDEHSRSRTLVSDLAHADASFFNVAHQSLGSFYPRALFVQLHGFRDDALPDVDLVVSAAGSALSARRVAQLLREQRPTLRVRSYPDEVRQLGGTSNIQAQHNRIHNLPFLHIEISAAARKKLLEPAECAAFARAIHSLAQDESVRQRDPG